MSQAPLLSGPENSEKMARYFKLEPKSGLMCHGDCERDGCRFQLGGNA
jgi:hypothetical protein